MEQDKSSGQYANVSVCIRLRPILVDNDAAEEKARRNDAAEATSATKQLFEVKRDKVRLSMLHVSIHPCSLFFCFVFAVCPYDISNVNVM
jgi:hypothetical protein